MNTKQRVGRGFAIVAGLTVILGLGLVVACSDGTPDKTAMAGSDSTGGDAVMAAGTGSQACLANPAWFEGAEVPEPDSATFPLDASNCDFHQWSWQMFLWLMEPVGPNQVRFETFPRETALHGDDSGAGLVSPFVGRHKDVGTVDLVMQAGPEGILVDQNGRAVYYTMYIDDTFLQFVRDNNLADPDAFYQFDPEEDFPVDAMTLKAAWKILGPDDPREGFLTRRQEIAKLTTRADGKIVLSETETQVVDLALVGFHIAGVVAHHPEMIWATFEQVRNAPDLQGGLDFTAADQVISPEDWTFYKGGTEFKDCNFNASSAGALKLDQATQVMTPVTQVCRLYPYGSSPDKQANADNIQSLNTSVHGYLDSADVRKNYFEVGAIWFDIEPPNKGLQPDCTFQPGALQCGVLMTGSTHLSNAVVETFTQAQSAQDNCFSCHNTVAQTPPPGGYIGLPGKNVNISHILEQNYFNTQTP